MPEGLLVLLHVVREYVQQRLGLLRAQVNRLEVLDLDLFGRGLVHGPEDELEVPHAHAHLDAVRIAFAVLVRVQQRQRRLLVLLGLAHLRYDSGAAGMLVRKGGLEPPRVAPARS